MEHTSAGSTHSVCAPLNALVRVGWVLLHHWSTIWACIQEGHDCVGKSVCICLHVFSPLWGTNVTIMTQIYREVDLVGIFSRQHCSWAQVSPSFTPHSQCRGPVRCQSFFLLRDFTTLPTVLPTSSLWLFIASMVELKPSVHLQHAAYISWITKTRQELLFLHSPLILLPVSFFLETFTEFSTAS